MGLTLNDIKDLSWEDINGMNVRQLKAVLRVQKNTLNKRFKRIEEAGYDEGPVGDMIANYRAATRRQLDNISNLKSAVALGQKYLNPERNPYTSLVDIKKKYAKSFVQKMDAIALKGYKVEPVLKGNKYGAVKIDGVIRSAEEVKSFWNAYNRAIELDSVKIARMIGADVSEEILKTGFRAFIHTADPDEVIRQMAKKAEELIEKDKRQSAEMWEEAEAAFNVAGRWDNA